MSICDFLQTNECIHGHNSRPEYGICRDCIIARAWLAGHAKSNAWWEDHVRGFLENAGLQLKEEPK